MSIQFQGSRGFDDDRRPRRSRDRVRDRNDDDDDRPRRSRRSRRGRWDEDSDSGEVVLDLDDDTDEFDVGRGSRRSSRSRRGARERERVSRTDDERETNRSRVRASADRAGRAVSTLRSSRAEEVRKRERMTEDAIWYLSWASQRVGPVNLQAVQNYINQGKLKPGHYVWRHGFSEWKFAYEVAEIASLFPDTVRKERNAIARLLGARMLDGQGEETEEKPAVLFCPHCGIAQDPDRSICHSCHQPTGFAKTPRGVLGALRGGNPRSWPREKMERMQYVRKYHHVITGVGAALMLGGVCMPWYMAGSDMLFGFQSRAGGLILAMTIIVALFALLDAFRKVSRKRSLLVFLASLSAGVMLLVNIMDASGSPLRLASDVVGGSVANLNDLGLDGQASALSQLASFGLFAFAGGVALALVFSLICGLGELGARPAGALTTLLLLGALSVGAISLSVGYGYETLLNAEMRVMGYSDVAVERIPEDQDGPARAAVFEIRGFKRDEEYIEQKTIRFGDLGGIIPRPAASRQE